MGFLKWITSVCSTFNLIDVPKEAEKCVTSLILTLGCFKGTTDLQFGVKQALTLDRCGRDTCSIVSTCFVFRIFEL